jgi:hypothetical protein
MNGVLKSMGFLGITFSFSSNLPSQVVTTQEVLHLRASELDSHPINIGALALTISRFTNGSFKVLITNSSEAISHFSPDNLTFLCSDGNQRYVAESFINLSLNWVPPAQIKIASRSRVDLTYRQNDEVKFPVIICYDGKPFAVVTK